MTIRALFGALALFALSAIAHDVHGQCTYSGGYPWQPNGCLPSKDLNAAIAGRNPLLNLSPQTHKWVNGFNGSMPTTAQLAFADLLGTVSPTQLPASPATTAGGNKTYTAPAKKFLQSLGPDSTFTSRQLNFGDVDGTLAPTNLLAPTATTLGDVKSHTAPSHRFLDALDTAGAFSSRQPGFSDISGTLAATQLPAPGVRAKGSVEAKAAVTNQFLTAIGTDGIPTAAQPSCANLSGVAASCSTDTTDAANISSGTLPAARLPNPAAATLGGILAESATAGGIVVGTGTDGHLVTGSHMPHVASNAALKALSGAAGQRVYRAGFAAAGDGGGAPYDWSTGNCAAADDGAQVQPIEVTGCWVADFAGMRVTPMIWGAAGSGLVDDRAAVQAAIDAMVNQKLYLGHHIYCIGSPGLVSYKPIEIIGEEISNSADPVGYGLTACASNMTMLKFGNNGSTAAHGTSLRDFYINAGANANIGNTAVATLNINHARLQNLYVYAACIGWDSDGVLNEGYRLYISTTQNTSSCVGVRWGHATTAAANTEQAIANSVINGGGDADLKIEDCGGCYVGPSNDFIGATGAKRGIWIVPGQNQRVFAGLFHSSYTADTMAESEAGIDVDTAHASARVDGLMFLNTWTSAVKGDGVRIRNRASGVVTGIHFTNHRSVFNWYNGFYIEAGTDISIDASVVCGNSQALTNNFHGVFVNTGPSDIAIRNSTIGSHCEGFSSPPYPVAIQLFGIVGFSTANIIVTGNNLEDNGTPFAGTPTGNSVIAANRGMDTAAPRAVASGATTALVDALPRYAVTGTTTINHLTLEWNGRTVALVTGDGAVTFTPAGPPGTLCNSFTSAGALATVIATYNPGFDCWNLH